MEFPEPVISMAIEPKSKADREKFAQGLSSLSEEDPTFRVTQTKRQGRQSLPEWANFTLKFLHDRMKREFSVEANVG